jgi:hypothetical protein
MRGTEGTEAALVAGLNWPKFLLLAMSWTWVVFNYDINGGLIVFKNREVAERTKLR